MTMFEWLRRRTERRGPVRPLPPIDAAACPPWCPGCDEASEPIEPLRIVDARPRDARGRFIKSAAEQGGEHSLVRPRESHEDLDGRDGRDGRVDGPALTRPERG